MRTYPLPKLAAPSVWAGANICREGYDGWTNVISSCVRHWLKVWTEWVYEITYLVVDDDEFILYVHVYCVENRSSIELRF